MPRLQVSYFDKGTATYQHLDVPDITTALIVAEINMGPGGAEIREGARVLARLEKQDGGRAPFWKVA